MRIPNIFPVIFACIAPFALPQLAAAQQRAVAPVPPQLERLDEGEAPAAAAARPESNNKIIEKRERGQVTSIRVERGDSTYYLKPNTQVGSALHGDAQSSATRAPQWQILEFDWGREPEKAKDAAARAATVAPPPLLPSSKNQ